MQVWFVQKPNLFAESGGDLIVWGIVSVWQWQWYVQSFPVILRPEWCLLLLCYDSTPIFPLFSLTWLHVPLVSTPPTPCSQHVPPNHGIYLCLHCTHVHYPLCPCSCLVPYGCAVASYHVPLTRSSMTHSSPLVLYTFPIRHASWSPLMSQVHHVSPSSEALCFFPWSRTILSFVYCFTFRIQLQTQTSPCI